MSAALAASLLAAPAAAADSLGCAQKQLPESVRTAIAQGYAAKGMDGLPEFDEKVMESLLTCIDMNADNAPEQASFLMVALQSTEVMKAAEKALVAHAINGGALDGGWKQLSSQDRGLLAFDDAGGEGKDPTEVIMKLLPLVKPGARPDNVDEKLVEHLTAYGMFRGMLESLAGRY